jgi:acetolactate synthase-1/2/3 large subunit
MKASDYIAEFIYNLGVRHVFTVSGAGDLHILDSIHRYSKLDYICNHHEQASGMAAYSYSRVTKNIGVALVTTGPGATNAITGVCSAWVDSVSLLMFSGQVKYRDTIDSRKLPLRQMGIQEINIVEMVRPITKYAVMISCAEDLRYYMEKAVYLAKTGRPGPVWLDIPMDVQSVQIDPNSLRSFNTNTEGEDLYPSPAIKKQARRCLEFLRNSTRPIILAGYGIKAAGAEQEFLQLVEVLGIPVCTTWNGIDLLESTHELYVGRPGTYGQRGANFAIQNSDLILSIGARLSLPQIGYEYSEFGRAAVKIYVDIDPFELQKFEIQPDLPICADAGDFLKAMLEATKDNVFLKNNISTWRERCLNWRKAYPTALPEYLEQKTGINSFTFIDILSDELSDDELIVPGASGTSFTCTHQVLRIKSGQTCFTSNGFAEMGFDLPGAIGACIGGGKKRTILITGDGSIQMNLQELQTIKHHELPIKIFLLNNRGYLTIRHTQNALFKGSYSASGEDSGVSFPEMNKIAGVYGLKVFEVKAIEELRSTIRAVLDTEGPVLCEIMMDSAQLLVPKTSFKQMPDGRLVSPPLEDLFPFLPRDEFRANMIIPTIKDNL